MILGEGIEVNDLCSAWGVSAADLHDQGAFVNAFEEIDADRQLDFGLPLDFAFAPVGIGGFQGRLDGQCAGELPPA